METSTIDAAGQAATSGPKVKKSATEIFGDVLAKFLDRIGTAADDQDTADESFFQVKPTTVVRDPAPVRPDEPELADTRKSRDEYGDDLPPPTAAALEAVRDAERDRTTPGQAATEDGDDKFHPDATAAPRTPSVSTESGAAARVPSTAQPNNAQAKDLAATAVPAMVPPPASAPPPPAPGGNAGNGPAPQIQVTVTQAPVQAQPAAALVAGSAVALQDQGAEMPKPTPSVNLSGAAISQAGANAGDTGAQHDANANANSGQPGFNNLPAGIVLPMAANALGTGNGPTTASFAAAVDEASIDGIGETAASIGLNGGTASTVAAGARRAAAAAAPSSPQLPRLSAMEQIAINVQKAVAAGKDQVTIQLRPEELGRIDVRLEVGKDGQVSAHVRADKPETLDLLQRDARGLERVLQDAGLRTDSGSLSFGLRGENSGNGQSADTRQSTANADPAEDAAAQAAPPVFTRAADGRVDLHV